MALTVCVQLPSRLRMFLLICRKDLLTLGGAVLPLWSAWTSTDPQFNTFNDNKVVIIHKLTAASPSSPVLPCPHQSKNYKEFSLYNYCSTVP